MLVATFTVIAGEIRGVALSDLMPIIVLEYGLVYACAGFVLSEAFYPVWLFCFLAAPVMALIPQTGLWLFGAVFLVGIAFATGKLGWPFKKSRPSFQDS